MKKEKEKNQCRAKNDHVRKKKSEYFDSVSHDHRLYFKRCNRQKKTVTAIWWWCNNENA